MAGCAASATCGGNTAALVLRRDRVDHLGQDLNDLTEQLHSFPVEPVDLVLKVSLVFLRGHSAI
jgi:hypothetical protein